jgi:hypothetical protein
MPQPGWLNEGMAFLMSARQSHASRRQSGREAHPQKPEEPFLRNISDPESMHLAHAESYLAVRSFERTEEEGWSGIWMPFWKEEFEEALMRAFDEDYSHGEKLKSSSLAAGKRGSLIGFFREGL